MVFQHSLAVFFGIQTLVNVLKLTWHDTTQGKTDLATVAILFGVTAYGAHTA